MDNTRNNTINISTNTFSSLGEELLRVAKALTKVSQKLQKISSVKAVQITPTTDPEMFTKQFIETVKKSRLDLENGRVIDYNEFRKSLYST